MTDQEKAEAIQKANSYLQMFELWAWQDFSLFLESERKSALESAVNSDELKDIQKWRGYVKCLDSIQGHLGYITSEPI